MPQIDEYLPIEITVLLIPSSELLGYVIPDGSKASAGGSRQHQRSSSLNTNPYEDEEQPSMGSFHLTGQITGNDELHDKNKHQNSPTPSIRGKKAKAFLEQHSSPPGLRVTAGGKIVPDGAYRAPPYSPPGYKKLVPKCNPHQISTRDLHLMHGCLVNNGDGRIFQIVDAQAIFAGWEGSPLYLSMAPRNEELLSQGFQFSFDEADRGPPGPGLLLPDFENVPGLASRPSGSGVPAQAPPALHRQIAALETQLVVLREKLRDLNRKDVLARHSLNQEPGSNVVDQRVDLTNRIDKVRCAVNNLRAASKASELPHQELLSSPDGQSLAPQRGSYQTTVEYPPGLVSFGSVPSGSNVPQMANNFGMQIPPVHGPPSGSYWGPCCGPYNPYDIPLGPQNGGPYGGPYVYRGPAGPLLAARTGTAGDPRIQQNQHGQHYPNFAPAFQPSAAEFVPSTAASGTETTRASQLQERSTNAGLGASPTVTLKAPFGSNSKASSLLAPASNSAAINLDGCGPQPRRSHALPIKKPQEAAPAKKNSMNPDSAVFRPMAPTRLSNENERGATMTSATQVSPKNWRPHASRSDEPRHVAPTQTEANGAGANDESFATASSATTADFFPGDAPAHSLGKWTSNSNSTSLQNWLPKADEASGTARNPTPVNISGTSFPFGGPYSPADDELQWPTQITDLDERGLSDPDRVNSSANAITNFGSRRKDGRELSVPIVQSSPEKDGAYWEGVRVGSNLEVARPSGNLEYMKGYRDGLVKAARATASPEEHSFARSVSCAASVFDNPTSPTEPQAPANSAFSRPLHQSSAGNESSTPAIATLTGSETGARCFGGGSDHGHPYSGNGRLGGPRARPVAPISPLASRNMSAENRTVSGAKRGHVSTGHRIFSNSKVSTSVAPSNDYASGWITSQLDGSNDDDDRDPGGDHLTKARPGANDSFVEAKGKGKAPLSPNKHESYAVRRLSSLGGVRKDKIEESSGQANVASGKAKKEDDPSKMSVTEKMNWKNKWQRRFHELKKEEQAEIDEYKRRDNVH